MAAAHFCFDAETRKTDDPAAIAWIERTKAKSKSLDEAVAETSKNPLLAQILCISVRTEDYATTFDAMNQGKRRALTQFIEVAGDLVDDRTIYTGYNVKGFDFPLIMMELQRLQISPPKHWPVYTGRYWLGRIHDSMEMLPTPKAPRMGETCSLLGISGKSFMWRGQPMTGARVADAYEAGDYNAILEYCQTDVDEEYELFLRQTFGGTYGTYGDQTGGLRDTLTDIHRAKHLSDAQKWAVAWPVLQSAGYICSAERE